MQQQEQDPTNLYFANLPVNMTETDLESMLSSTYGPVTSARILRNPYNYSSRGVGFARMASTEKCEAVIRAFNGKFIQGYFSLLQNFLIFFVVSTFIIHYTAS